MVYLEKGCLYCLVTLSHSLHFIAMVVQNNKFLTNLHIKINTTIPVPNDLYPLASTSSFIFAPCLHKMFTMSSCPPSFASDTKVLPLGRQTLGSAPLLRSNFTTSRSPSIQGCSNVECPFLSLAPASALCSHNVLTTSYFPSLAA